MLTELLCKRGGIFGRARKRDTSISFTMAKHLIPIVETFFDNKNFNPFIAGGAIEIIIDDYNGDNSAHDRNLS